MDGSQQLLTGSHDQQAGYEATMENAGYRGESEGGAGARREMVQMAVLSKTEKQLLHLAEADDVEGVRELLQKKPQTNVNAVDYQGRTALQIGVRNQCEEMVELLLEQPGVQLTDSLLFAIYEDNMAIIELLLDWEERSKKSGAEAPPPFDSAEFPAHMTPLMLASTENNYEAVKTLLIRGHSITVPSKEDYETSEGESLELGLARIDCYRALASPTYLCLSSSDPILTAFTLSHQADNLATADPIFKDEYEALSAQCRGFAVGLLNQCRTSDEVCTLLRHDHGAGGISTGGEYPRLRLALAYEQKEFVTHQNCQQVLQNLWTGHHPDVMWMNWMQRMLYFLPRIVLLPFIYLMYFFVPFLNIYDRWQAPMCKFMGDVLSYLIFLLLLLLSILHGEENPGKRVPDLNNGVDVFIWLWVACFIWDQTKIFYHHGVGIYFKHWWLLYGACMNVLFLCSFTARLAAYILANEDGNEYDTDLPRYLWPWDDPILVSEALYCIAVVLAFGRVLYIFQVSQVLGPLQLSLSRMMYDIMQMFCLIFITMFAFATGMTRLYVYYEGAMRVDDDEGGDGETVEQPDAFTSWLHTFRSLFWVIFGYGEVEYADVVVDNTCGGGDMFNSSTCDAVESHDFTQGTGYFLWALYHLMMVATLLNMLIGLMSNTLNHIQENADVEWKFTRSRLWMQYLEETSFLPAPLSLLPSVADIIALIRWVSLCCCCKSSDQVATCSKQECCYIEDRGDEEKQREEERQYKLVLERLMTRYLSHREQQEALEQAVTPDDLEQLKIDLIKEMHRLHGNKPGSRFTAAMSGN